MDGYYWIRFWTDCIFTTTTSTTKWLYNFDRSTKPIIIEIWTRNWIHKTNKPNYSDANHARVRCMSSTRASATCRALDILPKTHLTINERERRTEQKNPTKHSLFIFGLSFFIVCRFDRVAFFFTTFCMCVCFVSRNQKLNARVTFCASNFFLAVLALFHSPILCDLPGFKWTIDENVLHIITQSVCVYVRARVRHSVVMEHVNSSTIPDWVGLNIDCCMEWTFCVRVLYSRLVPKKRQIGDWSCSS